MNERTGKVDKDQCFMTIAKASDKSANTLDPDHKISPDTTAPKIIEAEATTLPGQQNPELEKVIAASVSGPAPSGIGSLGWGTIAGSALILLGGIGKFMGPPWNIGGALIQGVASRLLPNYERNKNVAVGTIVATDQLLTQWGGLLDALPEAKKQISDKIGSADPVQWMKDKLESAHQDLGVQSDVSALMSVLKTEITTKDGVLTPSTVELDKFLSKHI